MTGADSDDEPITLSSHALEALAAFTAEQDERTKEFERLKAEAENRALEAAPLSMSVFTEDWNESQFWYSDETAGLLASQLLEGAGGDEVVAVISAPSVFVAMKNLVNRYEPGRPRPRMILLEHDKRFEVFPEFQFYDFMHPFKLPAEFKGIADRIIIDPPFLSEDCQTKAALTARWMANPNSKSNKIIVCTGERMKDLVNKVYKSFGVKTTNYEPVHARGLSNEFYCYSNFECEHWKWVA